MKFKVGDKVRVREDLIVGKKYGSDYFKDTMLKHEGKCYVVSKVTAYGEYYLEGCGIWNFTDEMLEPAEFTIDNVQVNDIVTVREGDMYMIHELNDELFAIAYDEYNELKSYKDDFKEVDGLTDLDIVCVRRPEEPWHIERRCWEDAPIIWKEKKEPYDGKSYEELHRELWNWLADNPEKHRGAWFKAFYPDEERPLENCFACESTGIEKLGDRCEKCPICDYKDLSCLNGLYSAWELARSGGEYGIASNVARAIANLKWEEK